MFVTTVTEGIVDAAVAKRISIEVGLTVAEEYGKRGKTYIDQNIAGFNNAARASHWLVLRDIDMDDKASCALELIENLLPNPAQFMCFRIAVRSVESWLLADKDGLSREFGLRGVLPRRNVEEIENPKFAMLKLLRNSRRRSTKEAMTRTSRDGNLEPGPEYNAALSEFALTRWNIDAAAEHADSLARAVRRLSELCNQ